MPTGSQSSNGNTVPPIKIVNNRIVNNNTKQTQNNRSQSISSDTVFDENDENDQSFTSVKSNKRNRSTSTFSSPEHTKKKTKPLFVSSNRFSALEIQEPKISKTTVSNDVLMPENNINDHEFTQTNREPLPPPIFVRGIVNFTNVKDEILELVSPDKFFFKSSSSNLKIQVEKPTAYRKIIEFLKNNKAEYHTYQAKEDKAYRVVIRNLHSTTSTTDITEALNEIGFSVRQVSNVLHKQTKTPMPLFFVDLEPSPLNTDIFKIDRLLYTKIKIEEPHRHREIIQCQNCQEYGHTKKYCAYPSRCVRCGDNHPSNICMKPRDTPAKCALCNGDHPANYRGCRIHKQLQQLRQSNQSNQNRKYVNNNVINENNVNSPNDPNIVQTKPTQQVTSENTHSFIPPSYANATSNSNSSPSTQTEFSLLTNFLNEFKSLLNPLMSLLTTVLDKLISNAK